MEDGRWKMGDRGGEVGGRKSVVGGDPSAISDLPSTKKPEGFEFEVFYAHRQTARGQAEAGFGVAPAPGETRKFMRLKVSQP